jgi:hypothetical protein
MKLRFSIRDLLWLTLVVALIVGWYVERKVYRDRQSKYMHFRLSSDTDFMSERGTFKVWARVGDNWVVDPDSLK